MQKAYQHSFTSKSNFRSVFLILTLLSLWILLPNLFQIATNTTKAQSNGTIPQQPRAFIAQLSGQNVVPPITTAGRGNGFIILNAEENAIRVDLSYANLSSASTFITINGPATANENGVIAFVLNNPGGISGRFLSQDIEVIKEQVDELRNGQLYFSIRTANNPNGELRGQIRPTHRRGDFDGDGLSDISVLRNTNSLYDWYILNSSDGTLKVQTFGRAGDINVQADYDGDKMIDFAVFTPSNGIWTIKRSATNSIISYQFGLNGDVPMVGDYDGDGRTDITVFRPSDGNWYINRSSDNGFTIQRWGISGDKPVAGDFDGDGETDLAVFRPSDGNWYIFQSATQTFFAVRWGVNGDKPVAGDFDGDGVNDIAVYRPTDGTWYIYNKLDGSTIIRRFGLGGDIPVAAEYDGDANSDIAVFRPSDGNWYIWQSSTDSIIVQRFGLSTDMPLHMIYAP